MESRLYPHVLDLAMKYLLHLVYCPQYFQINYAYPGEYPVGQKNK